MIGLVGYPRSGKDTIAALLVRKHSYQRMAFGDKVKELLLATDPVYGDDIRRLEDYKDRDVHDTRGKLQRLGQTLRDWDPDFWVSSAEVPSGDLVVVSDIRYPNEARWVTEQGGVLVGVERPERGPVNDHESEKNTELLLQETDFLICNSGTLEDLEAASDRLAEYLLLVDA